MPHAHLTEHSPTKLGERRNVRVPLEFPSELPFEEHVAETKRHLKARTSLFLIVEEAFSNMAVGCDQFVYFDEDNPKQCVAPDLFVKTDSHEIDFDSWKTWEIGTPQLAVEIVSASDRLKLTWEEKFVRYEALGIRELVRFDARGEQPITIWDRVGTGLRKRTSKASNSYECKTLGLYWAIETSAEFGKLLRLARDRAGKDLLTTPSEKALELAQQLADERHARADAEHAKMLAEQKQRDTEAAHAAALGEIERLHALLAQARATAR